MSTGLLSIKYSHKGKMIEATRSYLERSVMDIINPEFILNEIKLMSSDTSRQTIWQFVIFTMTMAAVMLGGLKYQAEVLRKEMDVRFEAQRLEMNVRFEAVKNQLGEMEKNILSCFEDLKQEVRTRRQ